MSLGAIAITVLLVLLLLVILGFVFGWLHRQTDPARRSFRTSVRQLEQDIGITDRYQVPWVMVVGDQASDVEGLCASLQLKSERTPSWFGRWWYSNEGVLLVIRQDMFSHSESALAPLSAWRRLLGALLRTRAARPLDALIWVVSATALWDDECCIDTGLNACQKLADLQQRLGLSLPVYLVVTQTEQVPGFLELVQSLPREAKESMLGWSSSFISGTPYQTGWIDLAIDHLHSNLSEVITEIGTLQDAVDENLYLLPCQFEQIRSNLQALCDPVFRGNALGEAPTLRGIYFTGAQASTHSEEASLKGKDSPELVFAHHLLRKRIFAEQGLAEPVPRILRLRQRWQWWVLVCTAVLVVCWLLGMGWFFSQAREQAKTLQSQWLSLSPQNNPDQASWHNDDAARQSITDFWTLLRNFPLQHFHSPLYPTSLFSSLDDRVNTQLRYGLENAVLIPLKKRLQRDIEQVQIQGHVIPTSGPPLQPEEWLGYTQAKKLAINASELEKKINQFNHALEDRSVTLDEVRALSKSLFDLDLGTLPQKQHEKMRYIYSQNQGILSTQINLDEIKPEIAQDFKVLMLSWMGQLNTNNTFKPIVKKLQKQLQQLKNGQDTNIKDLQSTSESIQSLQKLIDFINGTSQKISGQEFISDYQKTLNIARNTTLIGPDAVQSVVSDSQAILGGFHKLWLDNPDLFVQEPTGTIALQKSVFELNEVLRSLLKQPFVVDVEPDSSNRLTGLNINNISLAMHDYNAYQKYLAGIDAQIPLEYRNSLDLALMNYTAQAMWWRIADHGQMSQNQTSVVGASDGDKFEGLAKAATPLLAALDILGQRDLSERVVQVVSLQALLSLRTAETTLQLQAPYQPLYGNFSWWDGSQNVSFKAFRVTSDQELKQYLATQIAFIGDISTQQASALNWLASHPITASEADTTLILRWKNTAEQLGRYKQKDANSDPALLESLISHDFNKMDISNCQSLLNQAVLPIDNGIFAERTQSLVTLMSHRCSLLHAQAGAIAYQELASYFNQHLSNHFPFSDKAEALDAAPEQVEEFIRLLDKDQALVMAGLEEMRSPQSQKAREFMMAVKTAHSWLTPLFIRNKEGLSQGVGVEVRWRTEREHEQGADQIIEWVILCADQKLLYPGTGNEYLYWGIGQPISLSLRWAKDSPQTPQQDLNQDALLVLNKQASWHYTGSWALFRFLRDKSVSVKANSRSVSNNMELMLTVPVNSSTKISYERARMFLNLSIMSPDRKNQLPIGSLPVIAPSSPFNLASSEANNEFIQNK